MTTKTFRGRLKSLALDSIELKKIGKTYHFEGWANRPVIDRYHEIVDVKAFEATLPLFARNPIMLYQHDARQPIGTFPKLDLRPDGLWVGGVIGSGFEPAETVRAMVEQKILKTLSIGFRETQKGRTDVNGVYHVTGLELLEISVVSIPANQEAIFTVSDGGKLLAVEPVASSSRGVVFTDSQQRTLARLHREASVLRVQLALRDVSKAIDERRRRRGVLVAQLDRVERQLRQIAGRGA